MAMSESQIRAQWEVDGRPRGIPYPDYRDQVIAQQSLGGVGGGIGAGGGGGGGGSTSSSSDPIAFWQAVSPDAFIDYGAQGGDGTIDYYDDQSRRIQERLNDPELSGDERRRLLDAQRQLDAEYAQPRLDDAVGDVRGASSDAEALAALQSLEDMRSSRPLGAPNAGGSYVPQGSVNPNDEATLRQSWNNGPRQQGVSYEEYKRQVQAGNPIGGEIRYPTSETNRDDGSPVFAPGFTNYESQIRASAEQQARNADITSRAGLGYFDNVSTRALDEIAADNDRTTATERAALNDLGVSKAQTRAETTRMANELRAEADRQNARSTASTNRLTGATNTANAGNLGALDAYRSGIAPYQTEIAGTTRQDVQFDPEGLAAQRQALGMGSDIYGGSLDYESQAAQAYANPDDIARALEGIEMLRENATTGGDNLREVLGRYRDISTPEMTVAERAILNQAQRQSAIHDKANREALLTEFRDAGTLSAAGMIASQQATQQRLGEERAAAQVAAQANAVQRALIGLQGMENTSGELRRGDLAASGAFTNASQRQREQGFQEEFSRGAAADTASANNQQTRVQGANIYANQANAIRSANDAVNMFNNEQQGITDRYNTSFKQLEYQRLTGLEQDTLNNTVGVNQTNLGNEQNLDQATRDAINQEFDRYNTGVQTGIGTSFGNYGNDVGYTGMQIEQARGENTRNTGLSTTRINTAGKRADMSRQASRDLDDALRALDAVSAESRALYSAGDTG